MCRIFGILLLGGMTSAAEPVCSRFHYEEQTLKKMILVELLVDKLKTDLEEAKGNIDNAISQWKQEREEFKTEIDRLQTALKQNFERNEIEIDKMKESLTKVVVFRARGLNDLSPVQGQTLVFKTTDINKGSGYDNTTGIFTAPVEGVFMLTVQLCVNSLKYIYIKIMADSGMVMRSVKIDDGSSYIGCYGVSVPVYLKNGEKVWIRTDKVSTGALFDESDEMNTFSGVLVHKMR